MRVVCVFVVVFSVIIVVFKIAAVVTVQKQQQQQLAIFLVVCVCERRSLGVCVFVLLRKKSPFFSILFLCFF